MLSGFLFSKKPKNKKEREKEKDKKEGEANKKRRRSESDNRISKPELKNANKKLARNGCSYPQGEPLTYLLAGCIMEVRNNGKSKSNQCRKQ